MFPSERGCDWTTWRNVSSLGGSTELIFFYEKTTGYARVYRGGVVREFSTSTESLLGKCDLSHLILLCSVRVLTSLGCFWPVEEVTLASKLVSKIDGRSGSRCLTGSLPSHVERWLLGPCWSSSFRRSLTETVQGQVFSRYRVSDTKRGKTFGSIFLFLS